MPELFMSTMNIPVMICWPKAMKYFRREDFMIEIYPACARNKKFGTVTHKKHFDQALEFA